MTTCVKYLKVLNRSRSVCCQISFIYILSLCISAASALCSRRFRPDVSSLEEGRSFGKPLLAKLALYIYL